MILARGEERRKKKEGEKRDGASRVVGNKGKARRKKEREREFPGAWWRGGARTVVRGHQHRNTIVFLTSLTEHAR